MAKLTRFRPRVGIPTDTGVTTDTLLTAANITRRTAQDAKELGNLGRYIQDETFKHWAPIRQREGEEAAASVALQKKAVEHQIVDAGETRTIREDGVILPDMPRRDSLSLFDQSYQKAMFGRYAAKSDQNMRTTFAELGNEFRDNPKGFADAAEAYTQAAIEVAPAGARVAMRENSDMLQSQILEGITTKKAQRDMADAVAAVSISHKDNLNDLTDTIAAGATPRVVINGEIQSNSDMMTMAVKSFAYLDQARNMTGNNQAYVKGVKDVEETVALAWLAGRQSEIPSTAEGAQDAKKFLADIVNGKAKVMVPVVTETGDVEFLERRIGQVFTPDQLPKIKKVIQARYNAERDVVLGQQAVNNAVRIEGIYRALERGDWEGAQRVAGEASTAKERRALSEEIRKAQEAEQRPAANRDVLEIEARSTVDEAERFMARSPQAAVGPLRDYIDRIKEYVSDGSPATLSALRSALSGAGRRLKSYQQATEASRKAQENFRAAAKPGGSITPAIQSTAQARQAEHLNIDLANSDNWNRPDIVGVITDSIKKGHSEFRVLGDGVKHVFQVAFGDPEDPRTGDFQVSAFEYTKALRVSGSAAAYHSSFTGNDSRFTAALRHLITYSGGYVTAQQLFKEARDVFEGKVPEKSTLSSLSDSQKNTIFGKINEILLDEKLDLPPSARKIWIDRVLQQGPQATSDDDALEQMVLAAYQSTRSYLGLEASGVMVHGNTLLGDPETRDLVPDSPVSKYGLPENWVIDNGTLLIEKAISGIPESRRSQLGIPENLTLGQTTHLSYDPINDRYNVWLVNRRTKEIRALENEKKQQATIDLKDEAERERQINAGSQSTFWKDPESQTEPVHVSITWMNNAVANLVAYAQEHTNGQTGPAAFKMAMDIQLETMRRSTPAPDNRGVPTYELPDEVKPQVREHLMQMVKNQLRLK